MYNLAICYEKGQGVSHSISEAAKYFLLAAEKGEESAQFKIANWYDSGKGPVAQSDTLGVVCVTSLSYCV